MNIITFALAFSILLPLSSHAETLSHQLDAKKSAFSKMADESTKTAFEKGVMDVATSGVLKTAINKGDKAPDFSLPNPNGKNVRLYDLLKDGPVILTWYRGGWCPYCNITLSALQKYVPEFEKHQAQLVAISPEKPDKAFTTRQKNAVSYHVLSDVSMSVSDGYGITYTVPAQVLEKFKGRIDLAEYNGEENATKLPLTVTYVVDTDGTVTYAFVDPDYRKRAEPDDILKAVEMLGN